MNPVDKLPGTPVVCCPVSNHETRTPFSTILHPDETIFSAIDCFLDPIVHCGTGLFSSSYATILHKMTSSNCEPQTSPAGFSSRSCLKSCCSSKPTCEKIADGKSSQCTIICPETSSQTANKPVDRSCCQKKNCPAPRVQYDRKVHCENSKTLCPSRKAFSLCSLACRKFRSHTNDTGNRNQWYYVRINREVVAGYDIFEIFDKRTSLVPKMILVTSKKGKVVPFETLKKHFIP